MTDSPPREPTEKRVPSAATLEEQRRITGRAGVVAAGTLVSRILGLGRELILAGMFSRAVTDAFMVAFTIPNLLRQLLAEGAVSSSVLPVLANTLETEGEGRGRQYFRNVRGLSLVILVVVSIVGVVLAPWLVELFAHGTHEHPGQFERTLKLTRWLFPYILFMGTAALGVAALNTHQRFVITAFAPGLLNVAFIVCGLLLPSWFAARNIEPMMALCAGVLLGGFLQVVAQWPSLRKIGYLQAPRLTLSDPRVGETLRRMGPVLLGIGVYAVDIVIARRFLSTFDIGAQSYFGFAQRLVDFPQGIFVMALQAATLPSLAKLASRRDDEGLQHTFAHGLRLSLFVGVSASVLFACLAEPLVALLFQRGEFDAHATEQTARSLIAQGAGIWAVASVRQLLALYYALGDTKTPVLVSLLDLGAFVALAFTWSGFGHVGISAAVTGASLVQAALLVVLLRRHMRIGFLGPVLTSLLKTCVLLVPAALAARWTAHELGGAGLGTLMPGLAGASVFTLVFLPVAWLARSEELHSLADPLLRRLRRGRAPH